MQVTVNGEQIDVTLENEKTVGDFLSAFEEEAHKNEATTISIVLNGTQIRAEQFEDILGTLLEENTSLDLTLVSKAELARALKQSANHLTAVREPLSEVSVMLQSGKEAEANAIITTLAEEINDFCHLVTLSTLFSDLYERLKIDGADMKAFFAEFTDILKDFESAMQAKDSVTVGDLAEYEISPRLEQIVQMLSTLQ